jgi:hypothetical protein
LLSPGHPFPRAKTAAGIIAGPSTFLGRRILFSKGYQAGGPAQEEEQVVCGTAPLEKKAGSEDPAKSIREA